VETVATRLQESGQHFVKQGDAFVVKTRDASVAFIGETRDAGLLLIGAVRTEAKKWRRFATQRATALQNGVRAGLSIPAVERALLTQVDATLRAIDTRVRSRLASLDNTKPAKKTAKKNGKGASSSRKVKPSLPPIAA
jgi:hypothetical protein